MDVTNYEDQASVKEIYAFQSSVLLLLCIKLVHTGIHEATGWKALKTEGYIWVWWNLLVTGKASIKSKYSRHVGRDDL